MKKNIIVKTLILTVLLTAACGQNEENRIEKLNINKKISVLSDSSFIIDIRNIQKKNQIFLTDYQANRIIVLDSNYNYFSDFGRSGSGPAEFKGAISQYIFKDTIYVIDDAGHRINIFSEEGLFYKSLTLPPFRNYDNRFAIDNNNNFYFSTIDREYPIIKLDNNAKIISQFGIWIKAKNEKEKRDINKRHILFSSKGFLVCVSVSEPLIEIYNDKGLLLNQLDLSDNKFLQKRLNFVKKQKEKYPSKGGTYILFKDCYLEKNELYLLYCDYDKIFGGIYHILMLDIENFEANNIKCFQLDEKTWYNTFCVFKNSIIAFDSVLGELHILKLK
jgi:hypothetical protein